MAAKTQKARTFGASLCLVLFFLSSSQNRSLTATSWKLTAKSCSYTWNDEPHPQVDFTWGLSNLKPAASRVSM